MPAAQSSSVVRLPQKRVTHSTTELPAMVDNEMSAATTPATQGRSRPNNARKYGCQA